MILSIDQLEQNEAKVLRPYAVLSMNSRGRKFGEGHDRQRLPFQKDRDRIIHSRAFRRLKAKTQVFVEHYGDHYRNRLTHSLEVAQISRDIARTLGLNEDLSEAIALAHDLGHTPFGHAGEFALNEVLHDYGLSFEHNEQSRRIVEELETVYPTHRGLNLSLETIEGLMKHSTSWDNPSGDSAAITPSLEAQVVNFGDEIAYQNHDVDDGLRSGIFTEDDLSKVTIWNMAAEETQAEYGNIENPRIRFSRTISKMIGLMIGDICNQSSILLQENEIQSLEDVYDSGIRLVAFSKQMEKSNKELKEFLTNRLYYHPEVLSNMERGQYIIKALFEHFMSTPEDLPAGLGQRLPASEATDRAAALRDYLAGMTDHFAELAAKRLGLL